MKHLFSISLAALLVAGFAGCGDVDVPATGYFGRVDTSGCVPTVCPITGDPIAEMKAWQVGHPCEPMPDELACRVRSVQDGMDWPDKVEEAIENASIEAEGFTDRQKEALRCLAYMPGVVQFAIGRSGNKSPGQLTLNMPVTLPNENGLTAQELINRHAAQQYIDRFGPYLGQIWNLNPLLSLASTVSGDIIITTRAEAYDGIPFRYPLDMEIRLDRYRQAPTWGGCPDLYLNTFIESQIPATAIETTDEGRLTPAQALQHVLSNNPDCASLSPAESETTLVVWNSQLHYRLFVGCMSHCGDYGWPFEAIVNAYTGNVVALTEECCVDCWDMDAMASAQPDSGAPAEEMPGSRSD